MSLNTILQYDFTNPTDLSPSNLEIVIWNGCRIKQPGASISLKSANFNGNSQYIAISKFTTPANGITFTFWFRSVNTVTWGRIFDFGNGSSSDNIIAYINNGNLGLSVYHNTNGQKTQYDDVLGYNVNFGNWIHIAWVLNTNNSWTLYVNGSIVPNPGSNPGTGYYPLSIPRSNNYIGKSNWNDPYFIGNICDFRMFDGILTQNDIINIYNTSTTNYLNFVRFKPSINNAISLTANTVMCNWSDLNIASNSNMAISFTINISPSSNMWRNILHISNTGGNCCNPGDRLPGIWIGNNNNNPNTPFILVAIDATNGPNQTIVTPSLQIGIDYTFVISLFNSIINIFCKQDSTKNASRNFGAGFLQVNPNTPVFTSDQWHPTDNYKIKDLIFYNNTLNQWDANNIFKGPPTPIIPWKYVPSIDNYIKLFPNNYVTRWSNLNIIDSSNMSVSFVIKLTNPNADFRNIFHITNDNTNSSRVPGVWINYQSSLSLLIINDTTSALNVNFLTGPLTLNVDIKVDIVWNGQNVHIYFNGILNTIYIYTTPLVKASDNAYFYLSDPWYPTEGGFLIKDFTFYNGSSINPPTSDQIFNYIGCYNDTDQRAIPNYVGMVTTTDQCKEFAISNKATLYGVQYGGQCFVGTDITSAVKYGKTSNCPPLGGAWNNQIYSVNAPTYKLWSSLNITDSKNMSLSFTINIQKINDNLRGIVHVTNSGSNSSNLGDRVPAIYVTPKASSLAIMNDSNTPTGFFT